MDPHQRIPCVDDRRLGLGEFREPTIDFAGAIEQSRHFDIGRMMPRFGCIEIAVERRELLIGETIAKSVYSLPSLRRPHLSDSLPIMAPGAVPKSST